MAYAGPSNHAATRRDELRYILISECLQNDLFLNRDCHLYIGDEAAIGMLAGRPGRETVQPQGSRLRIPKGLLAEGPLGVFLREAIGRRCLGEEDGPRGVLHVINIRDWHTPGPAYDWERRTRGSHCEAYTPGACYIDGLQQYLDPAGSPHSEEARDYQAGTVWIHHVHSDSVFDFKPRFDGECWDSRGPRYQTSELERLLDGLILGTDFSLGEIPSTSIYVAVIGVHSDVKIPTLLGGLRTRYDLPNLAVSDTLAASPSLERHISGLDFAEKVMNVEIIHGVNDLVRYLGGTAPLADERDVIASDSFARYQTFFRDKQIVLSYEAEKLADYLQLTEKRAIENFNWIKRSNLFLIIWGCVFLAVTLVLSVWAAVDPGSVDWKIPVLTGGLSLAGFVTVFYSKPIRDMQRNLTNLATFKMVLESHSLKTAFARFHLTTPLTLGELDSDEAVEGANRQVKVLQRELALISKYDAVDFDALRELGFHADGGEPGKKRQRDGKAGAAVERTPAATGDGAPTTEEQQKAPTQG